MEGLPFIDDYICTREAIADYVSEYSGIYPGDLNPAVSSHHLSTLKLFYNKLSYLIKSNCIIVGHGIRKDFKVINIVVPESQIRDTVTLFRLPGKRFISLKFLAWYFLGMNIQNEAHDSAEDAFVALRLYKKYLVLTENESDVSKFEQTHLNDLYMTGRMLQWKVPESEK